MNLTKKDRLLLINQYKILAALNKDEEDHYLELIEILENGFEIFYNLADQWISEDMPAENGRLVLNILDLYRAIDDIKRSSKDSELINHDFSYFRGFDGNYETEYMVFCRFLIEKQGKFQEQLPYISKTDHFNSHSPMIPKYSRMLEAAKNIESIWKMSAKDALNIINA